MDVPVYLSVNGSHWHDVSEADAFKRCETLTHLLTEILNQHVDNPTLNFRVKVPTGNGASIFLNSDRTWSDCQAD